MRTAALMILIALPAIASEDERTLLRGIEHYCVVISFGDGQTVGLSEDSFRAKVELPLRQSGLDLVSIDHCRPGLKCALVAILIGLMAHDRTADGQTLSYTYTLSLEVSANSRVLHNQRFALATLFKRGSFGSVGSRMLESGLDEALGGMVTEFANEALAAQPGPAKPVRPVKARR
jgi:hypothetical protein